MIKNPCDGDDAVYECACGHLSFIRQLIEDGGSCAYCGAAVESKKVERGDNAQIDLQKE